MHGFAVHQALHQNCEIHYLWNAKACGALVFFLGFRFEVIRLEIKNNMMKNFFFKVKKITTYKNNVHFNSTRLILQSLN